MQGRLSPHSRPRRHAGLILVAAAFLAAPTLGQAKPPFVGSHGAKVGHNSESGSSSNDVTSITASGGQCGAGVLGIAHLATDGVTTNHTAPSGWAQVDLYSGPSFTSAIWAHVYDEGESNPVFSWAEPESAIVVVTCYGGASKVTPVGGAQAASGNGADPIAPSVATAQDESLVAYFFSGDDDRRTTSSFPFGPAHAYAFVSENDEGASVGFYTDGLAFSGDSAPNTFQFHATTFGGASPCCEETSPADPTDWRAVSVAVTPSTAAFKIQSQFTGRSRPIDVEYEFDCSDDDFDQGATLSRETPATIELTGFVAGTVCTVTATPSLKRYDLVSAEGCTDVSLEEGETYSCMLTFSR